MKLKRISDNNLSSYSRKMESMGRGLLLVKIECSSKSQAPYHFLFENGKKPPLDVALNASNGIIDYIKFFLQDEKVLKGNKVVAIEEVEGIVEISIDEFDKENYQIFIESDFEISLKDNSIYVSRREMLPKKSVYLSANTSILFTEDNDFVGLVLGEITVDELNEMNKSEVLD